MYFPFSTIIYRTTRTIRAREGAPRRTFDPFFLDRFGAVGFVLSSLAGASVVAMGCLVFTSSFEKGAWPILAVTLALIPVGAAYVIHGISMLFGADATLRSHYTTSPGGMEPLPRHVIECEIRERDLPFHVCVRCRIVMAPAESGGRCPRCESEIDCIPVETDHDRTVAVAALL